LDSELASFGFTHLVTSVNPLKLATSLACGRFMQRQLPEIGSIATSLFDDNCLGRRVASKACV
ncbi:hypothetical protein, partial [Limnohabitans sp.]|jgi:hypothetical protein|uniref:hypothetical protein n=1 Tax=Limnohabitans sp. TaxID=1907725 RepID=UPI0037C1AF79